MRQINLDKYALHNDTVISFRLINALSPTASDQSTNEIAAAARDLRVVIPNLPYISLGRENLGGYMGGCWRLQPYVLPSDFSVVILQGADNLISGRPSTSDGFSE